MPYKIFFVMSRDEEFACATRLLHSISFLPSVNPHFMQFHTAATEDATTNGDVFIGCYNYSFSVPSWQS